MPESIQRAETSLQNLEKIKVAPITGVHFWFDRVVMDEPFVTLLDTSTQWVFNKTMLYGDSAGDEPESQEQYLQMVISASYDLMKKSRQEIIDLCLREVRQALPRAQGAAIDESYGYQGSRLPLFRRSPAWIVGAPSRKRTVPQLFFAGDWTATGWPATMEGAVRSGYLAAEAVLRSAGTPQQFLQPDLAPEWAGFALGTQACRRKNRMSAG